jgi:hypothetical protein
MQQKFGNKGKKGDDDHDCETLDTIPKDAHLLGRKDEETEDTYKIRSELPRKRPHSCKPKKNLKESCCIIIGLLLLGSSFITTV